MRSLGFTGGPHEVLHHVPINQAGRGWVQEAQQHEGMDVQELPRAEDPQYLQVQAQGHSQRHRAPDDCNSCKEDLTCSAHLIRHSPLLSV